jgi:acetyltransferase-like isoleucine patch superfamily enzyme
MENFKADWEDPKYNNTFEPTSIISRYCEVSGSQLGFYSRLKKFVEFKNSTLGDYSYVSSFSVVNATDTGKFCSIAHGVKIGLWEHNMWVTTHSFYLFESSGNFVKGFKPYEADHIRTSIGNDVWVGANTVIMKGIRVDDGSIIGAGSVVTRDVPPYAIMVGNPAKVLKLRFSENDVEYLLGLKWWEFSREKLQILVDNQAMTNIAQLKKVVAEFKLKT